MKKVKFNQNTKILEVEEIEEEKPKEEKYKLVINIITLCLSVISIFISVLALLNDNKMNERQLKISEIDESPYFILECENVWEELEETRGNDRIAVRKYTLKNIGGNIRNVTLKLDKYVRFCVPDKKLDKYHIFNYKLQYNTEGIGVFCDSKLTWEEPDKKVVFYEYTSENEMEESERKANELYEYLWENSDMYIMTYYTTGVLYIQYTDYMGIEKEEKYKFEGSRLDKIEGDLEGIDVRVEREEKIDFWNMQEVGKEIKESMDKWMDEDKESRR